jgi:hypothetical protein
MMTFKSKRSFIFNVKTIKQMELFHHLFITIPLITCSLYFFYSIDQKLSTITNAIVYTLHNANHHLNTSFAILNSHLVQTLTSASDLTNQSSEFIKQLHKTNRNVNNIVEVVEMKPITKSVKYAFKSFVQLFKIKPRRP